MLVVTIITVVTIIITDKKKVSKKEKVGKEWEIYWIFSATDTLI